VLEDPRRRAGAALAGHTLVNNRGLDTHMFDVPVPPEARDDLKALPEEGPSGRGAGRLSRQLKHEAAAKRGAASDYDPIPSRIGITDRQFECSQRR